MSKKPETKRKKKSVRKPRLPATNKQTARLKAELEKLRSYLRDAEETLSAIRSGEVDALLVSKAGDEQVFTLKGADHAYRVLVEEMNEGAATLNPEGIILFCNNSLASMLEMPLEQVIGSSLRSHIADDSLHSFDQFVNRTLLESGKLEVRLQKENGKLIPALLSGRKLSLDNVTGISIVVTDVSLQKQAQDVLRRSHDELEKIVQERTSELRVQQTELELQNEELLAMQVELEDSREKYADLYDLAPIGYFSLDTKGIVKEVNFAGCEQLGIDRYSLLGTPFPLYIENSDDSIVFSSHQKEALASDSRKMCEIRLKRKDRSIFYAQLQSTSVENLPDKARCIRTAVIDITERKRAEQEIEQANNKIKGILESISDGFMAVDREWRFTYINKRAAENVGFRPEQLIGFNIWQKFPVLAGTDHETYYRRAMEYRTAEHFEMKGVLTGQWYEISVYPTVDGISIFWLDISDRKEAQARISRQTAVLKGINTIFHAALSCDTEEELGQACLEVAQEVIGSEIGFIGEIGPDGLLHDIAISNPGWDQCTMCDKTGHRRLRGDFKLHGLYGRVIVDGKSFFTNEASSHPDSIGVPEGHPPVKAFLGSPLINNEKTIGMIAVANPSHQRGYQVQDVESLERLATAVVQVFLRKRAEKALRESEERLRTLSQATFEGVAISENGFIIETNDQFAEMHGYKSHEVLGKHVNDFIVPEEREDRTRTVRSGEELTNEYRALKKDGSKFFIEVHGRTIEEGGRTLRVSAIRDVTERKLAEDALHKNEERLREYVKLLEYAPVMVRNMNDEIILWNSGMARMYSYSAAEAIGKKSHDLLQTVFPQPKEQVLDIVMRTDRWEGELQHATGDGRKIIVISLWVLHKNAEGKATAIIEINSDITERRRAEEALVRLNEELEARVRERTNDLKKTINTLQTEIANRMEAEQQIIRLAAAVESAADALVITEPERGIIQYVNPAFEKITGYSRDEAVGRDLHMLESGRQGDMFFRELRDTLRQDGVWTGRMVHKKKDGTLYEEECTYSPVKNSSGEVINYISIKRDVTEKIRLESIAQAVDTMNNIGYIFAGVSHEIGNPINAIRITIDIMQRKLNILPKENVAEYLDRLMGQVQKVEYLLRGLKNFNMYESLQPNIIDLASFLEAFLSMVRKDFEAKGISIETVRQPDAKCVYADPRALQQVLLNIFTNASDALQGREDPKIAVSISASQGLARIQVKDNGPGIEESRVKDLFKPFYTTKKNGTGLGLVIIKKMMARMNGTVQITSRFNEGTAVELCLPCEKAETND